MPSNVQRSHVDSTVTAQKREPTQNTTPHKKRDDECPFQIAITPITMNKIRCVQLESAKTQSDTSLSAISKAWQKTISDAPKKYQQTIESSAPTLGVPLDKTLG